MLGTRPPSIFISFIKMNGLAIINIDGGEKLWIK